MLYYRPDLSSRLELTYRFLRMANPTRPLRPMASAASEPGSGMTPMSMLSTRVISPIFVFPSLTLLKLLALP